MFSPWYKRFDWVLAIAMVLLIGCGLLMLTSTTIGTELPYARNQLLFTGIGLVLFYITASLDYRWLVQFTPIIYASVVFLLVVVAIFAQATRGAASWLDIGPFSLQPSEFAKVAVALALAYVAGRALERDWSHIKLFSVYVATLVPPLILVMLQPDLGTTLVVVAGWLGAVWMSPFKRSLYAALAGGMISVGASAWLLLAEYQKQRIMTFLNPSADPLGSGYNVLQSIIAVGSGSWFGQGWGRGTQSHLNFLPEYHTDFIFASLSEEFGFVGSMLVIILYGIILWRGVRLVWHAQDLPTAVLVSSILVMFFFQAGVNIAMNVGLSPVTGIPLPLVSYGGSSLLATMITFGILQSVAMHQANKEVI